MPQLLVLPPLLFQSLYLVLKVADHVWRYSGQWLLILEPLLACSQFLLQFSQFFLFGDVLFVIFAQYFFGFYDFVIDGLALLLDFPQLLLEVLDLLLVVLLAVESLEVLGLLLLDPEQAFLFFVELFEFLLQCPELLLLADQVPVVVYLLELSLDVVYFALHLSDLQLLFAQFSLLLAEGDVVIVGTNAPVLAFT